MFPFNIQVFSPYLRVRPSQALWLSHIVSKRTLTPCSFDSGGVWMFPPVLKDNLQIAVEKKKKKTS